MHLQTSDMVSLLVSIGVSIGSCLIGFYTIRSKSSILNWAVFLAGTFIAERLSVHVHPLIRMLDIILVMFIGMKIITTGEMKKQKDFDLTLVQWLAFSFGWAGMRADIFQTLGQKSVEGWKEMILIGVSRLIAGLLIVFLAKYIFTHGLGSEYNVVVISCLLLIGFSLTLHFGLLSISAGLWRYLGVKTYYLFNSPLKSGSLNSFWGKRWNLAFSEMTSIAIYRPLMKQTDAKAAFFLSFLFSGLLHEAAISLPVNNGFGLPLLYFAIQGLVMLAEQFLSKRNITFFKNGSIAKLWMWFWIIVPAPVLFHIYFIREIIWPLAGLSLP